MNARKRPEVAFLLSFLVPGAGLGYLDRWFWAVVNFVVVQGAILILLMLPLGQEVFDYFHYVVLMLLAGSAGIAHAVASSDTSESAITRSRSGHAGA